MCLSVTQIKVIAQPKIVGGSDINITEAPWQAAIKISNKWQGGGVILGPDLIITAKHVVEMSHLNPTQIAVGVTELSEVTSSNLYEV